MKAKYSPTPDNKMTITPPTKAISPKRGNREATKTNKANIPTITPKSPTRFFLTPEHEKGSTVFPHIY